MYLTSKLDEKDKLDFSLLLQTSDKEKVSETESNILFADQERIPSSTEKSGSYQSRFPMLENIDDRHLEALKIINRERSIAPNQYQISKQLDINFSIRSAEAENRKISEEDCGLALFNRWTKLREETTAQSNGNPMLHLNDEVDDIARQQSILRVESQEYRKMSSLNSQSAQKFKHFTDLSAFLLKFFKSEAITQENLNLKPNELSILRSVIARKFNKVIKVESSN